MKHPEAIPSVEAIRAAVGALIEPQLKWTVADLNLLKSVALDEKSVRISLDLLTSDQGELKQFRQQVCDVLAPLCAGFQLDLSIGRVNIASEGVRGVRHVVLVGSGKGGVGKSSVAVNLAAALKLQGHRVGIMDADIYGPSLPTMLGVTTRPQVLPDEYLLPVEAHGLATLSLGYLIGARDAVDWRGNLASGTLLQFIQKTFWGELDFLIIDLPPGTGDIQLTLAHKVKSDGVLLVTTPQEVALGDVRRALSLFRSREIPVLGVVENMSFQVCDECGHKSIPFPASDHPLDDEDGTPIEVLARIPLARELCVAADSGRPLVFEPGEGAVKQSFLDLAKKLSSAVGAVAKNSPAPLPAREASEPSGVGGEVPSPVSPPGA
jgi:ATP-binding protein involved in chromosome partitioning